MPTVESVFRAQIVYVCELWIFAGDISTVSLSLSLSLSLHSHGSVASLASSGRHWSNAPISASGQPVGLILPIAKTFPLSETLGTDRLFSYAGRPGTVDLARAGKSRREDFFDAWPRMRPDRNLLLAVHDALGWLMTSKTGRRASCRRSAVKLASVAQHFENTSAPEKAALCSMCREQAEALQSCPSPAVTSQLADLERPKTPVKSDFIRFRTSSVSPEEPLKSRTDGPFHVPSNS